MSWWHRLRRAALHPPPETGEPLVKGRARAGKPAQSPSRVPPEEAYLRQLLASIEAIAATQPTAADESTVPASLGGREFWIAVDALIQQGREHTVREILRRLVALRPDSIAIAARLADLLYEAVDHDACIPLLTRLCAVPEHAPRAHFLLGEIAALRGEPQQARERYETVLAIDIDYPNARTRAARVAPPGSVPSIGQASPTLLGVADAHAEVTQRYRLLRELGRGTSGAVYLARDLELEREVALKLLHPRAQAREQAQTRARSFNEARIAAALRHPGVVAIYDLDETRGLIAMELCRGATLRHRLQCGPMSPIEALTRGRELLTTLTAVHRAGIVHLDIKPGNLLFRTGTAGCVELATIDLVLSDFGLAHLEQDQAPESVPGGTLLYLAPERRRGGLSTAVDLYAVGILLYEMLAGPIRIDRGALLRGDPPVGAPALPDPLAAQLGPAAPATHALLLSLTDPAPERRPNAGAAGVEIERILARLPHADAPAVGAMTEPR